MTVLFLFLYFLRACHPYIPKHSENIFPFTCICSIMPSPSNNLAGQTCICSIIPSPSNSLAGQTLDRAACYARLSHPPLPRRERESGNYGQRFVMAASFCAAHIKSIIFTNQGLIQRGGTPGFTPPLKIVKYILPPIVVCDKINIQ